VDPKVIGLDLSLTATGIAYLDGSVRTVKTNSLDGDRRLVTIVDHVKAACLDRPDLAVIEGPVSRTATATISGMVHGAVRLTLMDFGVPYVLIPPATLKAYATGKGTADKLAMAMAAYKRAEKEFTDDNQCDAWWLRIAGLDLLKSPVFELPAIQRARLGKVALPV
jgi:Holliday junction resolvasome RuvABC endonuclease subunit